MNLRNLKLELFYIRKSFFEYKKGFKYLYNKYFLAKKILNYQGILEKPISNNDLSIHILTSHKDLIMLLWSLASFYNVMPEIGELYIHNDGSLSKNDKKILKKFSPSAKIVEPEEFLEKFRNELEKYPIIKKFRTGYPQYFLLKKLIDPYFVSDKKYRLIIDSDLIWFKKPVEIEQEIKSECQNSLMTKNISIHPRYRVHFKNGIKLNEELSIFNSGIVLYSRDNFRLEKLKEYLKKIDTRNKYNEHFIEQGGYAYALNNLQPLPYNKYTIQNPVVYEVIVKHFTGPRRPLFYIKGLEKIKDKIL